MTNMQSEPSISSFSNSSVKKSCFCESRQSFCSKCDICKEPGHVRPYPGPVPYYGSWCDSHYSRLDPNAKLPEHMVMNLRGGERNRKRYLNGFPQYPYIKVVEMSNVDLLDLNHPCRKIVPVEETIEFDD